MTGEHLDHVLRSLTMDETPTPEMSDAELAGYLRMSAAWFRHKGYNADAKVAEAAADRLEALTRIKEPAASADVNRWLPIETAPKDGTRILAVGREPDWHYPFVIEWDASYDGGEGWWKHSEPTLDHLWAVSDSIEAWMPCPAPLAFLKESSL